MCLVEEGGKGRREVFCGWQTITRSWMDQAVDTNHVEPSQVRINIVADSNAATRLLHRTWQTLWKPLPELIGILGVEIPNAPEVSLAGIKKDAITLHWTKPAANKPVVRYLIQVNGVNGKSRASASPSVGFRYC